MNYFQEQFDAFLNYWPNENEALKKLRIEAFDQFKVIGLPNKKKEDWQFTDFNPLKNTNFRLSNKNDLPTVLAKDIPERIPNTYLLFFVNGHFQPQISEIPKEIFISTGLEHFKSNQELYSIKNESYEWANDINPFISLNTSMMNSGLSINIADRSTIKKPLQVIYMTTELSDPLMNHPRFNFQIGKMSQITIIEHHLGITSIPYFTNSVSNINLSNQANLSHIHILEDGQFSNHTNYTNYTLNKDSQLNTNSIIIGGKLFRRDINVKFTEQGGNAKINGLSLTKDGQHHDQHVTINHSSDSCQSDQLFKYILSEKSSGVFNGKVIVDKETKQTNANQTNKNLLLSENSLMNANPQLEIYAEDVKCSHGSTTGQIDSEALFYLRSRGITEQKAVELIVEGFAMEILEEISNDDIISLLNNKISHWLARETINE